MLMKGTRFRGRADANYKQFLTKFREMVDLSRVSGLLEEKRKEYELSAGKPIPTPHEVGREISLLTSHSSSAGVS